jgi:hypothetical protein
MPIDECGQFAGIGRQSEALGGGARPLVGERIELVPHALHPATEDVCADLSDPLEFLAKPPFCGGVAHGPFAQVAQIAAIAPQQQFGALAEQTRGAFARARPSPPAPARR